MSMHRSPAARRCAAGCLAVALVLAGGISYAQSTPTPRAAAPEQAEGGAPADATAAVRAMKAALEPGRPSIRTWTIRVGGKHGAGREMIAMQARKRTANGNRVLTVVLSPESARGTAFLVAEEPAARWVYVPAIDRVRQIVPVRSDEAFLQTDYTYADLGFVDTASDYRLLGSEDVDGVAARRIEKRPKVPLEYSRIVTWIAADTHLPIKLEYYDRADRLWKRERREYQPVGGIPTVSRMVMEDVQTGDGTEIRVSDVRYDTDIPDALFDPANLPEAANTSPFKSFRPSPASRPPPEGVGVPGNRAAADGPSSTGANFRMSSRWMRRAHAPRDHLPARRGRANEEDGTWSTHTRRSWTSVRSSKRCGTTRPGSAAATRPARSSTRRISAWCSWS
jgi:hypothetical protein